MRYIILTILVLAGCASPEYDLHPKSPDLEVYVQRFARHYDGVISNKLDVYMDVLHWCPIGVCAVAYCRIRYSGGVEYRSLVVDILQWPFLTDWQKEGVMFHELGHCVMNRDHTYAVSFMRPNMQPTQFYIDNRTEIYVELFGKEPLE